MGVNACERFFPLPVWRTRTERNRRKRSEAFTAGQCGVVMTVDEKATRLLIEHRLQIVLATDKAIAARVRGDSGIWDVYWSKFEGWTCSCPCWGRCSHIQAAVDVTMRSVSLRARAGVTPAAGGYRADDLQIPRGWGRPPRSSTDSPSGLFFLSPMDLRSKSGAFGTTSVHSLRVGGNRSDSSAARKGHSVRTARG